MLKVNNINVSYGGLQALWNTSLKVNKKEIVAVLGSNAAGKSTLLKTISGLSHPSSGSIEFLDKRIEKLPPYEITKLGIRYIPEGMQIFPSMKVIENLEISAYFEKSKNKINDRLEKIFNFFPILKERKNQLASTLSGGERQMQVIGMGLMSEPKLLMFDEPSFGLAPMLVKQIFQIVEKLNAEGVTILLVEQNIHMALQIADRTYLLENGKIIFEGTSKEFLKNPDLKKAYLGVGH